jgi:putative hydroxymethylpyrimidine transport system ATP-binding protein
MSNPDQSSAQTPGRVGLEVRNATLAWAENTLLDGLSFSAAAGTWTCLLGESGAGKTTLLRTIAGLITPVGTTDIRDRDGSPLADRVAYMAQQDLLLPWLTATENVTMGARLRGDPADSGRARELLARAGVADRADARPAELSGGERQRVALARTLMEERPIVLMDEPFSALDAITRVRLQNLAVDLLQDRTVLMVTHDPFEALRLADQIVVLRNTAKGGGAAASPIVPPAGVPRDPTDPALRDTHAAIMAALGGDQAADEGRAA